MYLDTHQSLGQEVKSSFSSLSRTFQIAKMKKVLPKCSLGSVCSISSKLLYE